MPPKFGGGGEKCARCGKTVEKVSAASMVSVFITFTWIYDIFEYSSKGVNQLSPEKI